MYMYSRKTFKKQSTPHSLLSSFSGIKETGTHKADGPFILQSREYIKVHEAHCLQPTPLTSLGKNHPGTCSCTPIYVCTHAKGPGMHLHRCVCTHTDLGGEERGNYLLVKGNGIGQALVLEIYITMVILTITTQPCYYSQ